MKEITAAQAKEILESFENDFERYSFFSADSLIIEQARNLVDSYGIQGLRTLDSIQLSTCVRLKQEVDVFITADKLLKGLMRLEGLPIFLP